MRKKYDRSPAQVIINWDNQHHIFPVVRSTSQKHQYDNFRYLDFELAQEDMDEIGDLVQGEKSRVEGQNPNEYEVYIIVGAGHFQTYVLKSMLRI
ncbi:aldo/keto reductase [Tetragenococcus halophilus]|uniref:aldo/keto reductase n=1 Tax=Tetragenococcus halophilus TaxID=51669 RepID=UPI00338F498F